MMGVLGLSEAGRAAGGLVVVEPGTTGCSFPRGDLVMRLLIEKSLVIAEAMIFVSGGGVSDRGSVLMVLGVRARGMVVSLMKVGGGAGGEVSAV